MDVTVNADVSAQHLSQIARVFSRAFFDDPFYTYVIPDPKKRAAHMLWWMRGLTRYGYLHGRIFTVDDPVKGAIIWSSPQSPELDILQMARVGLLQIPFRLGLRSLRRMLEVVNAWERLRKQEAPHWYLFIVGVDPQFQEQGLGTALVAPMLQEVDRMNMPCYLETMTPRNVTFYQRFGFEVVVEDQIKSGAAFWTMRRPPQS